MWALLELICSNANDCLLQIFAFQEFPNISLFFSFLFFFCLHPYLLTSSFLIFSFFLLFSQHCSSSMHAYLCYWIFVHLAELGGEFLFFTTFENSSIPLQFSWSTLLNRYLVNRRMVCRCAYELLSHYSIVC